MTKNFALVMMGVLALGLAACDDKETAKTESTETSVVNGTEVETTTTTETTVDDGTMTREVDTETTVDPEGAMNKETVQETHVEESVTPAPAP